MLVTFDYWVSFGKGDSGDSYIEMEVTEEEYARLQEAQESGEDFSMCESVEDLYERAYALAEKDATIDLREAGWLEEGKTAGEVYSIEVCFPDEDDEDEDDEDMW